jgi:hypothetical protein
MSHYIRTYADAQREIEGVADWIGRAVADGIAPAEIGNFVRSNDQLGRARAAVKAAGHTQLELSERLEQHRAVSPSAPCTLPRVLIPEEAAPQFRDNAAPL